MRTTLDLDPAVLEELRRRGRADGKSMGQVASELLARTLSGPDVAEVSDPLAWRSRDLGPPRIDLEDKEAVRRALEDHP